MSFSYLREYKFKYFEAITDPFSRWYVDIELTALYSFTAITIDIIMEL